MRERGKIGTVVGEGVGVRERPRERGVRMREKRGDRHLSIFHPHAVLGVDVLSRLEVLLGQRFQAGAGARGSKRRGGECDAC